MLIALTMIICFLIGVPIAFAIGLTGVVAVLSVGTLRMEVVPLMIFNGSMSFTLIAIPMFILMGEIMNRSSISERLIDFGSSLVGFIKGGLGMATILTGTIMAAISGSSVATASSLGAVLIPQMNKRGYDKPFATAIVSTSATISHVIPPSVGFILYAVSANVSIGAMFIAGIIPGLCMSIGLVVCVLLYARYSSIAQVERFELSNIWKAFKRAFLGLLLPLIVIGGIIGGIFTPTEAGAIGCLYAMFIGVFIYREVKFVDIIKGLKISAKQTAVVIIMVGTSNLLSFYLTQQRIPAQLATLILSMSNNIHIIIFIVSIFLVFAGCFIHGTPMILMLTPIFAPLMASMGMNLVQFGIIMCIAVSIGQVTPPTASVLMVTLGIAEIDVAQILKPLIPMLIAMFIVLLMTSYIPPLSLGLLGIFAGR